MSYKDFDTNKQKSFHILICMIEIWTPKDKTKPYEMGSETIRICEVENVEIVESFKKLIGTASVRFPRGTIYRRTISNPTKKDNEAFKSVTASVSQSGVLEETRSATSVVTTNTFNIGDRIQIFLGYTDDPKIAELAKTNGTGENLYTSESAYNRYISSFGAKRQMSMMFDGYITKISLDTPIELQCENLASPLKTVTCSNKTLRSCTVKSLLEEGKENLLEKTGLKLHSQNKSMTFDLGTVELKSYLSVADVLTEWAKYGIFSYVADDNGQPAIKVGRAYFSNPAPADSLLFSDASSLRKPAIIHFDYHVAANGLSLMSTDKDYLAVDAQGIDSKNEFFHVTILKNKAFDPTKEESASNPKYKYVNKASLKKKAMKCGQRFLTECDKDAVNTKLYSKISYISKTIPVTEEKLIEEAVKYFEGYNSNGIEGSLTVMGDLRLRTTQRVQLYDRRYPGKNGLYMIEEVQTVFGTKGFRQTITIPYCIERDGNKKASE